MEDSGDDSVDDTSEQARVSTGKAKSPKKKKTKYNSISNTRRRSDKCRPIGMCTKNSKYPVVRRVARRLGFREVGVLLLFHNYLSLRLKKMKTGACSGRIPRWLLKMSFV